jgi:hypothetical protein
MRKLKVVQFQDYREMTDTKTLRSMAKEASGLALRLASLPGDGLGMDTRALDELDQLATRILKETSSARALSLHSVGECRGVWRIIQPARP